MWFKPWSEDIQNIRQNLEIEYRAAIAAEIEKLKADPKNMHERVADLEVKMSKLWGLLVEQTPRGQDKLSKFGRRFGGMLNKS